jgi:hypothetical protein
VTADDLDRLLHAGALLGGEVVDPGLDPRDQRTDAADLLLGGHGLSPGPLVELGACEQALTVSKQVVEIGLQVREVGDVGA